MSVYYNTYNSSINCLLGSSACFLSFADFFSNSTFSKNSFRNTIRVPNSLDPDQARRFVGPDLRPNCLQSSSADDTSRQRGNLKLKLLCDKRAFLMYLFRLIVTR